MSTAKKCAETVKNEGPPSSQMQLVEWFSVSTDEEARTMENNHNSNFISSISKAVKITNA